MLEKISNKLFWAATAIFAYVRKKWENFPEISQRRTWINKLVANIGPQRNPSSAKHKLIHQSLERIVVPWPKKTDQAAKNTLFWSRGVDHESREHRICPMKNFQFQFATFTPISLFKNF